ncbi:hypothetical protein RYZ26_10030 [Terasakiella sp. A23]|uniref:hypothetical protein n=1 Tax=Terasakiella sp. FCG-A23 TaxID=3080561 RepID=UPI0029538D5A|nr:hypothetical protein [Terasakiella sp. A23]MDV7339933.1 hypothetical protein [Terasakiella sp. A23]
MKRLVLGVALSALAFSAQAQDSRYSTWSDPNKPAVHSNQQMEKLLDELNVLVKKARDARAADPNFLKDLEGLVAKYGAVSVSTAVQSLIFKDDFSDGDYTRNPIWKVASGKYWVEAGYGLRSFVEATAAAETQPQQRKLSKEEKIIGGIIGILGGKIETQPQPQQQAPATTVTPATIYTAEKINNAFKVRVDLSSWKTGGQFEFGPYQGSKIDTGYKLVYRPGKTPALQLYRNYTSSSKVVASANTLSLEDQKYHDLVWERDTSGQMTVTVDGKRLIQTRDTGFRDDFSGFMMRNSGGDYIIKSIEVSGRR